MSWVLLGAVGLVLGVVALPVLLIVPGWVVWSWVAMVAGGFALGVARGRRHQGERRG